MGTQHVFTIDAIGQDHLVLSASSTNTCKRVVSHCTAFVHARVTAKGQVHIEYCLSHIGHEPDPSRLWLDKSSEQLIVELLKEGFNYGQVKQKIRERYRKPDGSTGKENRLFFVTVGDIRAISRRNNLFPGRRDSNDLTSLEKRIHDNNVGDGFRYYTPVLNDTGDGFCLVLINETQRKWLAEFSHRGIGIDDTFNVSMYKLRLATIIVADNCDRALPAAFMLSFRCSPFVMMSENELVALFDKVKELVPTFAPEFFMSDDAASFYNAFRQTSLLGEFMTRIRLVSRSCKPVLFAKRYGDTLTFLLNEKQQEMVDYLHQNWTHRIEEWGAQHRKRAVMNTSMMCERWHKHLKREVFSSKSKIRIDELVDALITTVKEMKEDAEVIEQRGLVEGRWRLRNHLINHNKALSDYEKLKEFISVVEPGLWKIRSRRSNRFYMVEEERCTCKKVAYKKMHSISIHCRKPGCSACPYSFFCECDDDRKAGISCVHVHAVVLYAPQGRLANTEAVETIDNNVDCCDVAHAALDFPSSSSSQLVEVSDQSRLDTNKELLQQIEMVSCHRTSIVDSIAIIFLQVYASIHSGLRRIASQPIEQAEQLLNEALVSMKRTDMIVKGGLSLIAPAAKKMRTIALRPEVPLRGPAPADAMPIRMKTVSLK
ncbi:hypothetical protein COOONC_20973 [Cooperia oncophora]